MNDTFWEGLFLGRPPRPGTEIEVYHPGFDATTWIHDEAGRLLRLHRPNGTVRFNTWDAANQLVAVMDKHTPSGKPILALRLSYDAAGRLKDRFEVPSLGVKDPPPARSASYNLDNQMQSVTINEVSNSITSDADGNITVAPSPQGMEAQQTYQCNARNNFNPNYKRVEIQQHEFFDPKLSSNKKHQVKAFKLKINTVRLAILLSALSLIAAFQFVNVPLLMLCAGAVWLLVSNVLLWQLKCSQCGKRLMMTPRGTTRFFGLGSCAFCKHDSSE